MLKPMKLRKVIKILSDYGIRFDYTSGGKHTGKFYNGPKSVCLLGEVNSSTFLMP